MNAFPSPDVAHVGSSTRTTQFFALTLAITSALQLPAVAAKAGLLPGGTGPYMPLVVLGVFGPACAALWLTRRDEGATGVRRLLSKLSAYQVAAHWYLIGLLLPGLMLALGCAALRVAGHGETIFFTPGPGRLAVGLVICVGEELGWRGYALPRLQRSLGPVAASGAIGIVWTLWHIPMFLGADVPLNLLPVMFLQLIGGSLMFTWIYNRTGGSLLLAVLAHFGAHLNNSHLALPHDVVPAVIHAIVYAAIGLSAVALDRKAFPQGFRR